MILVIDYVVFQITQFTLQNNDLLYSKKLWLYVTVFHYTLSVVIVIRNGSENQFIYINSL